MSRLLMLLPSTPWPADAGAKIRNAGLVRLLRERYEVDVLPFSSQPARSDLRRARDLLANDLPDMAHRLWSPEFVRELSERLQRTHYDAFQAEGIEMARYLGFVPQERRIYDAHNAEFLLQLRLASGGSLLGRAYSRVQARRLQRFESAVVRGSRMTLAVSQHDANQLLALAGGAANVQVVPNAIDVASYPFHQPRAEVQPNVLFVGKLDFRPNADALGWFVHEVLLHVDARLFAVGAAPPKWLVHAGQHDARIAVTGHVADERQYFARCTALVLPVRTGGGSRLKALVAMASGLPIISTRLGMEGLEVEEGAHFLAAETASEWVAALRSVFRDAALRRRLACSARELVQLRYDWTALRDQVRAAYAWL